MSRITLSLPTARKGIFRTALLGLVLVGSVTTAYAMKCANGPRVYDCGDGTYYLCDAPGKCTLVSKDEAQRNCDNNLP